MDGKSFQQLNTEGKRKLRFHRSLVSEKTPMCDSCWQGMMLCPWSQWIFCHLLQGTQDWRAGLWVESGPCPDLLACKRYIMTDGEFLWWRGSTALLICVLAASLFTASLCSGSWELWPTLFQGWSCAMRAVSLSASAVRARRAQRDNVTPGRPGGLTSTHQRDGAVDGWRTHSKQSSLCWRPLQGLQFHSGVPQLH